MPKAESRDVNQWSTEHGKKSQLTMINKSLN